LHELCPWSLVLCDLLNLSDRLLPWIPHILRVRVHWLIPAVILRLQALHLQDLRLIPLLLRRGLVLLRIFIEEKLLVELEHDVLMNLSPVELKVSLHLLVRFNEVPNLVVKGIKCLLEPAPMRIIRQKEFLQDFSFSHFRNKVVNIAQSVFMLCSAIPLDFFLINFIFFVWVQLCLRLPRLFVKYLLELFFLFVEQELSRYIPMQRLLNLLLEDLLLLLALFLLRFAFPLSGLVLFIRSGPHRFLVSLS
jgi:hypothetical protein